MTSVADRKYLDRQPSPILEFWEIEVTDDDNIFAVDFYDRDADDVPPSGVVAFDGDDYIPVALQRSDIQVSTGGDSVSFSVTVSDPEGTITSLFRANDWLTGARATLRVIPYDQLGVPSSATSQVFTIRSVAMRSTPDSLTITVGDAANLFDHQTPTREFSFHRCLNPWHRRHDAGSDRAWCTYPSDNFSAGQTAQRFYWRHWGADTAKAARYGWSTINTSKTTLWETGQTISSWALKAVCQIQSASSAIEWATTSREGPFMYKTVTLGDFAVETRCRAGVATTRSDYYVGILVQDSADVDSWISFSRYESGLRVRAVDDGASSSEQTVSSSDTYLKLERTGTTTWKCYSKASSSAAWTLRFTVSSFTLADPANVGLAIGSDDATTDVVLGEFAYFHFESGGPADCNRTIDQCQSYQNEHQYNGFPDMPINV